MAKQLRDWTDDEMAEAYVMETPNTQAGYLTERIMEIFGLRSMAKVTLPTLDTQQYNAIYSHVLGTLEEAFSLLPPKRKDRI